MSNTVKPKEDRGDVVPKMSHMAISKKKDEVKTYADASRMGQKPKMLTNTEHGTVDLRFADFSCESHENLIYNALTQIPMWRDLPHDIMVLLTGLSAGFIQTCWDCKIERSTDSRKCSAFQCASCRSIESRLEELEVELSREVYYDNQGNMIPRTWFNYTDSDCGEDRYTVWEGW